MRLFAPWKETALSIVGREGLEGYIGVRGEARAVIHYHHANDTLPIGTLHNVLEGTRWTEDDLRRLGLIT